MALVGGRSAGAHLLQRHHHLHHVHLRHDFNRFGRRDGGGDGDDLLPADVDIHQHAGYLQRLQTHRLLRALNVDRVVGDKPVDHIKLVPALAVQLDDPTVFHFDRRDRVKGAFHGDQSLFRPLANQPVLIDGALGQYCKSF